MTTPTTSIDALPVKVAPSGAELLIVQDAGVTKKMAITELSAVPSPALTAHLADIDDAHDATAISAVDSGNGISGANVQAQLGQLSTLSSTASSAAAAADAKIVAHLAAALDAHDASAISAIAGIILTGTDVQTQLNQIETALQAGGAVGPDGPPGPAGPGVPTGGTAGQLLSKINADDFSSQWISPLWLPTTGGTVHGVTRLVAPVEALQIARVGGTNEHLGFYNEDFSARHAYIMGTTADMKINSSAAINIQPFGTTAINLTNNAIIVQPGFVTYLEALRTSQQARLFAGSAIWGTGTPTTPNGILQFYGAGTDSANIGTRTGYIGHPNSSIMYVINEVAAGQLRLQAEGSIVVNADGVEMSRWSGNAMLIGKANYNTWSTVEGAEIWVTTGQMFSTNATATTANQFLTHLGTADANAVHYIRFYRTGSVIMGTIAQVNLSAVSYNTTSDSRLKTFTRDVDDEEALQKVRDMRPLHFTWNHDPDSGEQIGFFAQELIEVAPEAVTVGSGEPDDEPDEEGNGGFVPWGTDVGKLVPRLVAAMQAMDHKIVAMRTEITNLQAEVAVLKRHGPKK